MIDCNEPYLTCVRVLEPVLCSLECTQRMSIVCVVSSGRMRLFNIYRQLAECCKPLLEDASLAECFAQHLVRHFYQLASVDKDSTSRPLLALLRCLKVVVRVCVSTAAQPAFQTLSHAVGR